MRARQKIIHSSRHDWLAVGCQTVEIAGNTREVVILEKPGEERRLLLALGSVFLHWQSSINTPC